LLNAAATVVDVQLIREILKLKKTAYIAAGVGKNTLT
jgi:hypothetical protein